MNTLTARLIFVFVGWLVLYFGERYDRDHRQALRLAIVWILLLSIFATIDRVAIEDLQRQVETLKAAQK